MGMAETWLFMGRWEHLLTPDRELTTAQSTNTARVQLGDPRSFVKVTGRSRNDSEGAAPQHQTCIAAQMRAH